MFYFLLPVKVTTSISQRCITTKV